MSGKCGLKTEVYSRVVGYYRPVEQWNKGKQEEFKRRRVFEVREEQLADSSRDEGEVSQGLEEAE